MNPHLSIVEAPCDYEVIGEHLTDPTHLLVMANDGQFYALSLLSGQIEPIKISDEWVLDTCDLHEKFDRIHLN